MEIWVQKKKALAAKLQPNFTQKRSLERDMWAPTDWATSTSNEKPIVTACSNCGRWFLVKLRHRDGVSHTCLPHVSEVVSELNGAVVVKFLHPSFPWRVTAVGSKTVKFAEISEFWNGVERVFLLELEELEAQKQWGGICWYIVLKTNLIEITE